VVPNDFEAPPGSRSIRWPDAPLEQERRLGPKMEAVGAFAREPLRLRDARQLCSWRDGDGKTYRDLRQVLDNLGIDEAGASRLGPRLYKVGLTWPLEAQGARRFEDLGDILVVE
jgi:indolepyruvate ferredoxin oxidoreductase